MREILYTRANIFLTGAGGVGKTFLVNSAVNELRNKDLDVAVTAITGIAAKHLFGKTLHSWSCIGVSTDIDYILNTKQWRYVGRKRLAATDVLIIDEISMLGDETFHLVDDLLKIAKNNLQPFGGCRLIVVGDFFQLPPIRDRYCFEGNSWKEFNFTILNLYENYRANDEDWINVLKHLRVGNVNQDVKDMFSRRITKPETDDITRLVCLNREADVINKKKLAEINNPTRIFKYEVKDLSRIIKPPDIVNFFKNSVVKESIPLKIGAYVMIVVNDKGGSYVNGTCGEIIDMDSKWIHIRTDEGYLIKVLAQHPFLIRKKVKGKFKDANICCTPVIHGWAVNIHKAQGVTLKRARIDLSNGFADGQAYVAFSRIKSEDGVYLDSEPSLSCLQANRDVLQYTLDNIKEFRGE